MTPRPILRISSALVLATFCTATGCTRAPAEATAPAPTPITVSYPVEREVTDYADFTARIAAVDSVEVRARVSGYLHKIDFKEGALVSEGDVLFVIDPRPFVAELNRAKAHREEAKAAYTKSIAQFGEAEAQESRAAAGVDYNQRRFARSQKLRPSNAITQEEFDLQKSELLQNQADLERARAMIASSKAAIGTADAAVQSAQAAVDLAQLNLDYTSVTAPISGRISREFVTKGNLVQAGDLTGGTLLTTIVSVDPMYAYFDVDEQTVLRVKQLIREGKAKTPDEAKIPVLLGLANEDGHPHLGSIHFIDNQVNPRTGTLRVRGAFRNEDDALSPGFFARVRVPIGVPHKALLISERALDTDLGQKVVYIVDKDNRVTSRPVRLGSLHDSRREITDGLKPGDRVIVNGLQLVRPGATVEPNVVDMPTSKARKANETASLSKVAINP